MFDAAAPKLSEFGIELLTFVSSDINYNHQVLERIYQRMISERLQIAERFCSEGEGEAEPSMADEGRELNQLSPLAYKQVQEIVWARPMPKPTEIYALAYAESPESVELYQFLKSMETYRKVINTDATIVFS